MMQYTLHDRLLKRELGNYARYSGIKGLYGDRQWIRDMDIVNELDGHSGCVNALSWSKSGNLLASGSDDQHVNIHSYQSDGSSFELATSISTGHSANIFSVKFMPHSNDRTLISAAGDSEIRIFDIEYAGRAEIPSEHTSTRAQGFTSRGVQYLTQADTNCRVYRSHSDRVKRIVTESSPHLFLTCSEDGEVRQWDLRQPSSAYPRPMGGGRWRSHGEEPRGPVPPPLISYKKWGVSLNTISCSPSQPYYILLGGEHLCAFLHDRRMLGRDMDDETGGTRSPSTLSDHDEGAMGTATQCVKRFAPKAQRRIKSTGNGHITAAKISDANPNEAVISWSGDWIYSFDMLREPDARELRDEKEEDARRRSNKAKRARDRKPKRREKGQSPGLQEGVERGSSRTRSGDDEGDLALRVSYQNGQSENIPVRQGLQGEQRPGRQLETISNTAPTVNVRSFNVASQSASMQDIIFDLGHPLQGTDRDPTGHAEKFSSALRLADIILEDMYDISRAWTYPVTPDELEVAYQDTLRSNRESAMRFVQAAGTLSRLLGGELSLERQDQLFRFATVQPVPNEKPIAQPSMCFSYDFLKAIVLWLSSGPGALIDGFSRQWGRVNANRRLPCPEGSSIDAIDEYLVPYLMDLADDHTPIYDLSASPYEIDENRIVYSSQRAAVQAFARAVQLPFHDVVSHEESANNIAPRPQSRRLALRFWGFKVGRSILLNAAHEFNYAIIDKAFGGNGAAPAEVRRREQEMRRRFENIDPEEEDLEIENGGLGPATEQATEEDEEMVVVDDLYGAMLDANERGQQDDAMGVDHNLAHSLLDSSDYRHMLEAMTENNQQADEEEEDDVDGDDDDSDDDDDENDDNDNDTNDNNSAEEDDDEYSQSNSDSEEDEESTHLFSSRADRRAAHHLHSNLPILPPIHTYTGHCNVKTVKDVNFFGLDDEYVVSGSDSGHVFIWDRHTSQLINILEGDGEVVNVIQGHPYEPVLAVSGIDSTVKIFSAEKKARRDARRGVGVAGVDVGAFSSLRLGGRGRMGTRTMAATTSEPAIAGAQTLEQEADSDDTDTEPPHAPNGLSSRKRMAQEYEITSRNDHDRRGGNRDAFITRGVLARLAQQIMARRAAGAGVEGGGGGGGGAGQNLTVMTEDGEVVVDTGNCEIM